MDKYKPIVEFINKDASSAHCHWSQYTVSQLKQTHSLELIYEIILHTGKMPSEAVFIFLASIKYICRNIDALAELEKNNSFPDFIKSNQSKIFELSIQRNVQANMPERGLPIMEVLAKYLPENEIGLIELGASFGIIGTCLLNPKKVNENSRLFFQETQQLPKVVKGINNYVGIEIDPPDKDWLLAGIPDSAYTERINKFINYFTLGKNYQIIKSSAFGFANFSEVQGLFNAGYKPVVLTSFMLYQLQNEKQKKLIQEINVFTKTFNGHWINQDVDLSAGINSLKYYIAWDGERIIELNDDMCTHWKWIE